MTEGHPEGEMADIRWRGSGHGRLVGGLVRRDVTANVHE